MTHTAPTIDTAEDTITVPTGIQQVAIVQFIRGSALEFCTDLRVCENGAIAVTPSWPVAGFSTGEQILWALLDSLVRGELADTYMRLDAHNLAAFATLTQSLAEAVTL